MSQVAADRGQTDAAKQLRERLAFMGLDAAALQALRAIKPIVDREVPRALDKFYQRAQATPETRAFFADQAMVERAKAAQAAHWRRMAAGDFDARFLETAWRVGQTHARIGLPPKWYAAATPSFSIICCRRRSSRRGREAHFAAERLARGRTSAHP